MRHLQVSRERSEFIEIKVILLKTAMIPIAVLLKHRFQTSVNALAYNVPK